MSSPIWKTATNTGSSLVQLEIVSLKGIENAPMSGGENEPIPFLTGENLVNRLLNKTLIPCAADILELNKKETAYETQLLIKYIKGYLFPNPLM
jgi:hypothetical protein